MRARDYRKQQREGTATSAAHEGCRSVVVLGRRILQQLEHTEDVHKVMFEALVSEKTGAELRGMCDDQAGRDMKRYQEEAVALRNLCLSREQRERAG